MRLKTAATVSLMALLTLWIFYVLFIIPIPEEPVEFLLRISFGFLASAFIGIAVTVVLLLLIRSLADKIEALEKILSRRKETTE